MIATVTNNFAALSALHLSISDPANYYYSKSQTYTVTSSYNAQVTIEVEKKYIATFSFLYSSAAIPGLQITLSASGMTAKT